MTAANTRGAAHAAAPAAAWAGFSAKLLEHLPQGTAGSAGESSAGAHESGMKVKQGWVQAVEMLRQACAVDPAEYEAQAAHNDSAGVRYVAAFITDLAERCCPACCPWPDLTLGVLKPKSAGFGEGRADWGRMFC